MAYFKKENLNIKSYHRRLKLTVNIILHLLCFISVIMNMDLHSKTHLIQITESADHWRVGL